MSALNDYKDWFSELDLSENDYEAASQLVHALRNICDCGLFRINVAKGVDNGWIISADGVENKLHLISQKQLSAFVSYIQDTVCKGMDAEAFASYMHEMEKGE